MGLRVTPVAAEQGGGAVGREQQHQRVETDRFTMTGRDGSRHTVIEYTDYLLVDTPTGPDRLQSMKAWRTTTGEYVYALGDGRYRLFGSDIVHTRDAE